MLFEPIGYVYLVEIQDVGETRAPIQFIFSADLNDTAVNMLAFQLKDSPYFQGYFDNPPVPVPMKVARITELATTRPVSIMTFEWGDQPEEGLIEGLTEQ